MALQINADETPSTMIHVRSTNGWEEGAICSEEKAVRHTTTKEKENRLAPLT